MNFFSNKKILIYGLGKSGLSTYQFLKNKNNIYLYDDFQSKIKDKNIKKKIINFRKITNIKFVCSPISFRFKSIQIVF